jgi:type II restriction enzyme
MRRGFRCKEEILVALKEKYNEIVNNRYNGKYLDAIQHFDFLTENELRAILRNFYSEPRSRDQAWKTCKGTLYEYAVFKTVEQIVASDEKLSQKFMVMMGEKTTTHYGNQIIIRNWSEIFPDVDILIIEKETDLVKVIISCKTSLRERLTETAFWKRELERSNSTKDIRLAFVTTDKDDELRIDTNRYILLHVVDCTFLTDHQKYEDLIKNYEEKYGSKEDFSDLISKIKTIEEIGVFLHTLE